MNPLQCVNFAKWGQGTTTKLQCVRHVRTVNIKTKTAHLTLLQMDPKWKRLHVLFAKKGCISSILPTYVKHVSVVNINLQIHSKQPLACYVDLVNLLSLKMLRFVQIVPQDCIKKKEMLRCIHAKNVPSENK